MSSSESRTEVIKPLVIKAAIPAALSVAAYVCAKLLWTRTYSTENLRQLEEENTYHEHNSASLECPQSEILDVADLQDGHKSNLEDKLEEPQVQAENHEKRETDLGARFRHYQCLKEKEFMLTEMRNLMMMEKTRAECLLKEISLMEEETKRIGELAIEYTKLVQRIEALEMENGLLKSKARKHWRIAKLRLRMLRKQKFDIEGRDVELLRNREELEKRDNLIQELEDEVGQLKAAIDHLQREKLELFNKVGLDDHNLSESSNPEIEIGVSREDYEKVVKEVEQLKKERADEEKEVAYLKWSNACLRHQLLRHHEQANSDIQAPEPEPENGEARMNGEVHDCSCTLSGYEDEHCLATLSSNTGHVHSRRRRLVQKFKRWVEGGKNIDQKEKSEIKCFGAHSPHEDPEHHDFVPARKSCSSV